MPRDGSGQYSLPAGSTVSNGQASDAVQINAPLNDIATDLNAARPISAGGTGATNAANARTGLGVPALTGDNEFTGAQTFSGNVLVQGSSPLFAIEDTSSPSTHRSIGFSISSTLFTVDVMDSDQTVVHPAYRIDMGASGATQHDWYIGSTSVMKLYDGYLEIDTGDLLLASGSPIIHLEDTNGATSHRGAGIRMAGNDFKIQVENSQQELVADAYQIDQGANGALLHKFFYQSSEALRVDPPGTGIPDPQTGITREKGDNRYASASSAALKDNPEPVQNSAALLNRLSPKQWLWNEKAASDRRGTFGMGFIAEEVEQFLPEAVRTLEGDFKVIDALPLIAVLTEEIKKLRAELNALKQQ